MKKPLLPPCLEKILRDERIEALGPSEFGGLVRLLLKSWELEPTGTLPDDKSLLARWAGIPSAPDVLLVFEFQPEDGRYHQKELEAHYQSIQKSTEQKRKAGVESGKKRRSKEQVLNTCSTPVQQAFNGCSTGVQGDMFQGLKSNEAQGGEAPIIIYKSKSTSSTTKKKKNNNHEPGERPRDLLFDAVATVTASDPTVSASYIGKVVSALRKAQPPYTPEEVFRWGELVPTWGWVKGTPTLGLLEKHIGRVREPGVPRKDYSSMTAEEIWELVDPMPQDDRSAILKTLTKEHLNEYHEVRRRKSGLI